MWRPLFKDNLHAGNCWMGTDGTDTPSDQSVTSDWVNSVVAGVLHSPWNSSFPIAFSAAACSSFSIYSQERQFNMLYFDKVYLFNKHWMFYLLWVPVEVQIWHDLPWVLPWYCSSHPEHLPSQHPPHETNRMVTLQTSKSLEMLGIDVGNLSVTISYVGHTLLLQGIAMSTYLKGESVLHRAMVGILTYDASVNGWWSARGSVTIKSRGSLKAAWIWLVNVPGVNRPWKVVAPVAAANFRTAL